MINRNRCSLLFVMLGFSIMRIAAQTTDLARIEYLNFPLAKSNNSIERYRALLQVPIPINKEKKNFFVIGLEYRYLDINIKDTDDILVFGNNPVNSIKRMDGYLAYTWKQNEDWRLGIKAGVRVQSDFNGSLLKDDFIYEAGFYVVKDKRKNVSEDEKPYRLIAGLTFSNTPGRKYPLPIINYYKEFQVNWTYTLGVPKTNIRYFMNNSHKDALQVFATLDNDYANIQKNFVPSSIQNSEEKVAESIQSTIGLVGLGYEHFFTKQFLFYSYVGHTVYSRFQLEDSSGSEIYKINTENSPYFRAGIKFKY